MKMMSSTSITSTMGVTLISVTTGGAFINFIFELLLDCPRLDGVQKGKR
jgi:hypothetical protein